MNAEVMVMIDGDRSGRIFNLRTYNLEYFDTTHGLAMMCQTAWCEKGNRRNDASILHYPAKEKLVLVRISIYAVDQNGIHGILHMSPSEHAVFRGSDEFERLINRVSANAIRKQQTMARTRNDSFFPNETVNAL